MREIDENHEEFNMSSVKVEARINKLISIGGRRTADNFHRELGIFSGITVVCQGIIRALKKQKSLSLISGRSFGEMF